MSDQDRFLKAANRLEELVPHMKEIIQLLREGGPHVRNGEAYAQVYELRREVGYIVRTLGVGVREPSTRDWNE